MIDVSCICPTYSRPHLLEETIESFLRQDFTGTKELIILNDYDKQELIFEHPEVRVINTRDRFNTLGEKYNAMFDMAKGRYITPWEDDDIFLPHRISHAVDIMDTYEFDYYKLPWAFYWNDKAITSIIDNIFYCTGMWSSELLKRSKGCDAVNSDADQSIEKKLKNCSHNYCLDHPKRVNDIFYIYRWGGVTNHLSGYGTGEIALLKAQQDLRKDQPTGRIELNPRWEMDYVEVCNNYLKDKHENNKDM